MYLIKKVRDLYQILDENGKRNIVILLLISLFTGVLESAAFSSIAPVVNEYFLNQNTVTKEGLIIGVLSYSMLMLLVLFVFRSIFLVVLSYFQAISIFKIQATLSDRLFEKYILNKLNTNDSKNINILAKNVIVEAQNLTQHGYLPMLSVMSDIIITISLSMYLVYLNGYELIIFLFAFMMLLFILGRIVRNYLYRLGFNRKELDGYRYQYVNEAFDQKNLLFAHSLGQYFKNRYSKVNLESARLGGMQSGLNMSTRWVIELIIVLALVLYMILPGSSIPQIGQIVISASIAMRLLPLSSKILSNIQRLDYSGSVLYELKKDLTIEGEGSKLHGDAQRKSDTINTVVFNKLRLEVLGRDGVFFNKLISLSLKKGSLYAIKGPNGAGKSTFINALIGSIEATTKNGSIDIVYDNNNKVSCQNIANLSSIMRISYVPQTPTFLDASIRENLVFDKNYSEEEILNVIKKVGLGEYITNLEKGIDTHIGDKYGYFSGGQRQRLAIARALINKHQIIILDEPTSATDFNFTQDIISILRRNDSEAITLIVTHSDNLSRMCDYEIHISKEKLVIV
jgi:ATP-binding cassette, subfamily B, bacterial PglK